MNNTSQLVGLSSREAKLRLEQYGYNEIEEKRLATFLENSLKLLSDPMGLMLLALSLCYWLLGNKNDAIILLFAYIPIVSIDVLLELRSQKALRHLKRALKQNCHVIRDSKTTLVPVRELVPGDLLILEEGQMLPADGTIVQASNLSIDEASLTGESIPVSKSINSEAYSGTTLLTGTGIMEITKTGLHSEIGKIAKVLGQFDKTQSPLLRDIKKWVRIVFIGALVLALLVFIFGFLKDHSVGGSLITALTLAMAAIPEEFPLVFTLYLGMAAYRLSKKGVLIKSLPSVEGLGRVDIICTDKTGTLTEGKFILEEFVPSKASILDDELVLALMGSCEMKAIDAMEAAIFEWIQNKEHALTPDEFHQNWKLIYDYPFNLEEKYMSHVWRNKENEMEFISMKGSIEGVLAHCDLTTDKEEILKIAGKKAAQGKRLLGLAWKAKKTRGIRAEDENDLIFLGFLSFADPIRPSVPAAIKECSKRGIQIKMLTGDHPLTAHAIADAIGLPHAHDELYSGPQLELLSEQDRVLAFQKGRIFSRLKPEQKLELVKTLKDTKQIVAMTGDGINDAPALKLADIGISMGERATDVARSSAHIVLLKSDFGGIVSAIIEGQNVLKSLSNSFGYLIAFHIPIILIALVQAFFLDSPLLKPIHIVLLELIVHPVSAFVFSESKAELIQVKTQFLSKNRMTWSAFRGTLLSAFCLWIYFSFPEQDNSQNSITLLILVLGNIGLVLAESGGLWNVIRMGKSRPLLSSLILLLFTFIISCFDSIKEKLSISAPPNFLIWNILAFSILLGFIVPYSKQKTRVN